VLPQMVREMLGISRGSLPLARLSPTTAALHREVAAKLDGLLRCARSCRQSKVANSSCSAVCSRFT